jgi:calcium-dependent protein kinase
VNTGKLQQAAMEYIVSQINDIELGDLVDLFYKMDKNGDGSISLEEFQSGIASMNSKNAAEIEKVFKTLDADSNGSINYTEFLAATIGANVFLQEERLHQAFQLFDKNGDGKISVEEIKSVLGCIPLFLAFYFLKTADPSFKETDDKIWKNLLKEADTNGDGVIDYSEFIFMMQKLGK